MSASAPLADQPFTYWSNKDGKVFIQWQGQQILVLKAAKAARFLADIQSADPESAQLLMARITGNFKRGNERPSSS